MKKNLGLALMAVLFASNSFAIGLNESKVFNKLNNQSTVNSLSKYLEITNEQKDQLKYIFELTSNKINDALKKEDEIAAEKAVWFNLGNAKLILTDTQYRKYLTTINLTINTNNSELFAENL